jgi:hypothetical protein
LRAVSVDLDIYCPQRAMKNPQLGKIVLGGNPTKEPKNDDMMGSGFWVPGS